MKNKVVLIGVGEVGGVFARGFLKLGHSVYPVTRDVDLSTIAINALCNRLCGPGGGTRRLHHRFNGGEIGLTLTKR